MLFLRSGIEGEGGEPKPEPKSGVRTAIVGAQIRHADAGSPRRIAANIAKLPDSPSQIRVKGVFMRRTIDSKRDAVAISDLSAVPIRCVPARAARLIGASFWGKK
jgi:hypothetical protein